MRHIVNPDRLYADWRNGAVTVVDCRFVLGQPEAGLRGYAESHIPGAVYLDLERELSAPKREDGAGGRHPLPDPDALAQTLTRLGITNRTKVVAYDEQGGAMASRLWWLLTYLGHDDAHVLNGGFAAWKQAGYPVVSGAAAGLVGGGDAPPDAGGSPAQPADGGEGGPAGEAARFVPRVRPDMLVTAKDIAARSERIRSGRVILLDSREEARYRGISESVDKAAGHIPGAKHLFWKSNLDAEGRFRPLKEQMKRFEPFQGAEEIIVYCGSGVTACPTVLSLREAGFSNVKLYAGSWSDWISDASRPIATAGQ